MEADVIFHVALDLCRTIMLYQNFGLVFSFTMECDVVTFVVGQESFIFSTISCGTLLFENTASYFTVPDDGCIATTTPPLRLVC